MKNVTIYSTPTCHFCHLLKDHLSENDVAYTEVDLTKEPEKQKELIAMTGQLGVPVTKIENDIVVGFQREKIDELLGL